MAVITTYATLKTAVADYLARSDLTSFIPNFVQAGEQRIYRELVALGGVQKMMVSVTGTLTGPTNIITLPSRFYGVKRLTIISSNPQISLRRVSYEDAEKQWPVESSGLPQAFSILRNIVVYPFPSEEFTYTLHYWEAGAPMSNDSDAPWIITDAPDIILYASLLAAESFIKNDPRIPMWAQMYTEQITALKSADLVLQTGNTKLRSRIRS